jgi:molybdopterin-guanine dinucleotide biosynthesis protein A
VGKEILKEHHKHAPLARPSVGDYHRHEFGFIGAPCDVIKKVVNEIQSILSHIDIAYIDASHKAVESPSMAIEYLDNQSFQAISFPSLSSRFDHVPLLSRAGMAFVNSNHFAAKAQIVFINSKKKESLFKKMDRLTDIQMIILDDEAEIFDFLKPLLASRDIPAFRINEITRIADHIITIYRKYAPVVKGLVMAGGQSLRMGVDKASIAYHGTDQLSYLSSLFAELNIAYRISTRADINNDAQLIDSISDAGPIGGLLSAFRAEPDTAWLSVACDLPFITAEHLKRLLNERDPSKFATAYHNPSTGFPEPMICLWEPRSYGRMFEFLALGYSCPRKVLINSRIKELKLEENSSGFLFNANTPLEREEALKAIKNQS